MPVDRTLWEFSAPPNEPHDGNAEQYADDQALCEVAIQPSSPVLRAEQSAAVDPLANRDVRPNRSTSAAR